MRMKQYLRRCLMVNLLFCALLGLVISLEDKNVIHGLVSGLGLDLPSSEVDENLEEVLIVKCKLELMNFKRLYESLGFDIPDESDTSTMQTFNDLNNMKSTIRVLHPQTRENLLTCVRDNYLIAPVSGEDVVPGRWYLKHLEFLFPKSYLEIKTRRNLAEASVSAPAPAPVPSPQSPAQTPSNTLVDLPTVISPENAEGTTNPGPDIATDDNNSSHKTVIVAVVVTATVTFLVATILFFCCRKYFGGSRFGHKDD